MLEKIPLAGIARVTGVLERWLQGYVNDKYSKIPQEVNVKNGNLLIVQLDKLWCFLLNRSRQGAQRLWNSLPQVYRHSLRLIRSPPIATRARLGVQTPSEQPARISGENFVGFLMAPSSQK